MTINEAISNMHPCDVCERVRAGKWCTNCKDNRAWQDNFKLDLNVAKLVKFLEEAESTTPLVYAADFNQAEFRTLEAADGADRSEEP